LLAQRNNAYIVPMKKGNQFRFDIVFLRAFSVIAVTLYHFQISPIDSGYVGVDVFFVISGYLMTQIILSGFSNNTFSLLTFYQRRVARIFPPLLALVLFLTPVVFLFLRIDLVPYLKSAMSSSLFFSNVYYYFNGSWGYFNNIAQQSFLTHTWSLSVEWQFYMLYPLLLLPLRHLYASKRTIFHLVFFGGIILSMVLVGVHQIVLDDSSFVFYMFYTRAWEMMIGGLAFLFATKTNLLGANYRNLIVLCSIFILGACCILGHPRLIVSTCAACATAAIIWSNVNWSVFRMNTVHFLGKISYSLYLWHWPLWVVCLLLGWGEYLSGKVVFIALSILFGTASYYLIEKKRFHNVRPLLVVALSSGVLFFLISILPQQMLMDARTAHLSDMRHKYLHSQEWSDQYCVSDAYESFPFHILSEKWAIDTGKKNIVLLGNSHMSMFNKTFYDHYGASNNAYHTILANVSGYPPIPTTKHEPVFQYFYQEWFPKHAQHIDLVVICWDYSEDSQVVEHIDQIENYFHRYATQTIYIGQNEIWHADYTIVCYLDQLLGTSSTPLQSCIKTNNILKEKMGDKYIDLINTNIQRVSKDGKPYMHDDDHLSQYGAEAYFPHILKHLKKTGV